MLLSLRIGFLAACSLAAAAEPGHGAAMSSPPADVAAIAASVESVYQMGPQRSAEAVALLQGARRDFPAAAAASPDFWSILGRAAATAADGTMRQLKGKQKGQEAAGLRADALRLVEVARDATEQQAALQFRKGALSMLRDLGGMRRELLLLAPTSAAASDSAVDAAAAAPQQQQQQQQQQRPQPWEKSRWWEAAPYHAAAALRDNSPTGGDPACSAEGHAMLRVNASLPLLERSYRSLQVPLLLATD
jgi:hypothetical protein